jgi:carboxyl-terminal processing protease
LNYVDKNRKKLKEQYPTFSQFKKEFNVEKLAQALKSAAEKEDLVMNQKEYDRSERVIKVRIKAMVAQNIWDYKKFYEIINELNNSYNKAIQILEDGSYEKVNLASN